MRIYLSPLILVSLLASCGGSSGGGGNPPASNDDKPNHAEIPSGEKEVFSFDGKTTFANAGITCKQSGYGYSLDDKLNKMAVCCIAVSSDSLSQGDKFIKRQDNRIVIKPERCDATVLSGTTGDLSLPVDIDVTGQKLVSISLVSSTSMFAKATGQITMTGSTDLDTKLVGPTPLSLYGKSKVSNIHSMGTAIGYYLRDTAGYNDLQLTNVKIEGKDSSNAGLILSAAYATTTGTSGMSMRFDHVSVTADKENPVTLSNYPFDISGIEILAGKKYAPHFSFQGKYTDTTGQIIEKRYPVVTDVQLMDNSKLVVGPGVKIKVPTKSNVFNGGTSTSAFYSNGAKYTLILEGSPEEHITVTSIKHDGIGGDTNGDGNATKGDLVGLLTNTPSSYEATTCLALTLHYVDLYGALIPIERECPLRMGNVSLRPAESGKYWRSIITLGNSLYASEFGHLVFDAPVEAWHPIETYTSDGKLRANSVIYSTSDYRNAGGKVDGLNYLTVHNTSTSASKVESDLRLLSNDKAECGYVQDSAGQVTSDVKSWVFYIDDSNTLKPCP